MAKKLMGLQVNGKHKTWEFTFYANPDYIPEWVADGLDIVLIENVIPEWIADLGLVKIWCFFQDLWNFRNPFRE